MKEVLSRGESALDTVDKKTLRSLNQAYPEKEQFLGACRAFSDVRNNEASIAVKKGDYEQKRFKEIKGKIDWLIKAAHEDHDNDFLTELENLKKEAELGKTKAFEFVTGLFEESVAEEHESKEEFAARLISQFGLRDEPGSRAKKKRKSKGEDKEKDTREYFDPS